LELTFGRGHSLANGHVARTALAAGAALLVNSDGHIPPGLLTAEMARRIARGAGLTDEEATRALQENALALRERLRGRGRHTQVL
jgi:histidinol phosphatase-like PHP family hydrolase